MLLMVIAGCTYFIQPVKAATLTIMSHSGYLDIIDAYHVFGEFQNREDKAIKCEKVTATFYDSSNKVIAVQDWHIGFLEVILPNQKSPFEVLLWDPTTKAVQVGPRVDHYSLEVTASYTSAVPLDIEIIWSDTHFDFLDYLNIDGELKNADSIMANGTTVFATCYDANGKVVCTSFIQIKSEHLLPGETSSFEITNIYPEIAPSVKSYRVVALAYVPEEYVSSLPKTPSSVLTLIGSSYVLVFAVIAIAAVAIILTTLITLRRKKKPQETQTSSSDTNTQPQQS